MTGNSIKDRMADPDERPERIWAWAYRRGVTRAFAGSVETVWSRDHRGIGTEYVRGDVHAAALARIAELERSMPDRGNEQETK